MAVLLGLATLAGCGTGSPTALPAATSAASSAVAASTPPSAGTTMSTASPAGSTTSPTSPARTGSSAPGAPGVPVCGAAGMSIALGTGLSPQTGEQGVVLTVRNEGHGACAVRGYLTVHFRVTGSTAEQTMAPAGGMYVTSASPAWVTIAPQKVAYVIVAAYRCDLGGNVFVESLSASLPGSSTATTLALGRSGVGSLPYCPGQQGHSPSYFQLSPIEPTLAAAAGA